MSPPVLPAGDGGVAAAIGYQYLISSGKLVRPIDRMGENLRSGVSGVNPAERSKV
jgi:hypothetical protein